MTDAAAKSWKPTGQRIAPQEPDEWDERTRAALGQTRQPVAKLQGDAGEAPRPLHILTTLAHHSELLSSFIGFASTLTLKGRLPRRDAEILSLRASWNCRSDFEWGHHRLYGLASGLSEDEIADIAIGADAPRWNGVEAALIRAADELHVDRAIGEATWKKLAAHYDEAQLIELLFTVGQYTTLSTVTNTLRIALEPHLPGLPAEGRVAGER